MKIHQVGGVFYDSNIFVIEAEKPIVIDSGTGSNHSKVVKNIEHIMNPKDIGTLVLSHRHFDHTGGAEALQKALDAEIIVHETAAGALRSGDDITTAAKAFGKSFPKLEVNGVNEGDVIDCGDLKFAVLHTPGHSICSMALYHPETKTLICGDTVYTDGGIGRWDLPTGNYQQLVASLKRLAGMEVANLYPGHGPSAVNDGQKHIALGLKYAQAWG
ncbi:MAG: MBL fold metallo-hydrolase [Thermoplasmata archaeon]|nr:MAG: MBL fold metallo-hydrolase [Thermoplasmata archaeon]